MLMMMIMIMMPIKLIVLFEVKWHMCGTDSFVFSLVPQVGFKFLLFTQLFFVLTSSRFEIWPKFHFDSFYFTLYFCSSLYCSYYTCLFYTILFYTVHIIHVYSILFILYMSTYYCSGKWLDRIFTERAKTLVLQWI